MSQQVKIRHDTAANIALATPVEAELAYATDTKRLSVGDGTTAGGIQLAKASEASPTETQIHAATGKTTPVDADELGIVDSAASNVLKKLTWANLKATLWVALGPAIAAFTGKTTPVDADTFAIADSAASSAPRKLTWANVKAALNTYLSGLGSLSLVAGDILYASGAATLARLAKGTDGMVLTLASGLPSWAAAAASGAIMRNRIVNPSMQLSSINGNTSGTTNGYSPADNWGTYRVTSAGTITTQRVQSATAAGSKDRARITITAADASLAAGEYLTFTQSIVGQEVADLLYGTASAKNIVLRFGFKGPAGTYAVHLGNSAANRSYVALFTISAGNANADTTQTVSIVGDTTGTWLTDTGTGITLDIVLACGSTFQGTTGWQAGNLLGTSGVSNGMGTISAVFEIFDVGLYGDPSATGVAPTFETPSYGATDESIHWGLQYVRAIDASTSASLDFDSSSSVTFEAGYDYIIEVIELQPASDAYLMLRYGTGATPTYQATGYTSQFGAFTGTNSLTSLRDAITTAIPVTAANGTSGGATAGETINATVTIHQPAASAVHNAFAQYGDTDSSGLARAGVTSGKRTTTEVLTGLRLLMSTGNITSGKAVLYRRRTA